MKKHISIVSSLALMLLTIISANFCSTKEVTDRVIVKEIVETQKLALTEYELSKLYTCKQETRKDSCLEVNQLDANLLMLISRAEGGDTLNGQLWTMRTILNRLSNGSFGNSIWEIISSFGQFAVFINGSYIYADVNSNTHLALAMIEGGWNETQGALYWRMDKDSEGSWHDNNLEYIATIEGNRYYR